MAVLSDVSASCTHFAAKQFDTDISSAFPMLLSFRSCFHSQLSTVLEVACLFLSDHHALCSTFSDVSTAYMLLLTLLVTVATCERPFSKLKLIENFLRSSLLCLMSVLVIWSDRKPSCSAAGYVRYCWRFCTRQGTITEVWRMTSTSA